MDSIERNIFSKSSEKASIKQLVTAGLWKLFNHSKYEKLIRYVLNGVSFNTAYDMVKNDFKVSLISAVGSDGLIGVNGKLPWYLPTDFKYFRDKTVGNHVIMGRKTFESLKSPLKDRVSVIITRQKYYKAPKGCKVVYSLSDAIEYCKGQEEIFVIGGYEIYNEAIKIVDKMYITNVETEYFPCVDSFLNHDFTKWVKHTNETLFPVINKSDWKSTYVSEMGTENNRDFNFEILDRIYEK